MPVTIKKQTIKYRNPDGTYTDFNAVAQESTADQIAAIQASGAAEVQDVEAAGSAQIAAVNQAGATQVAAVNQAGSTQVAAVNQAGAAQVNEVGSAAAEQMQAIEEKGEEVKASIPEEYSDLSADVVDLKSSISGRIFSDEVKAALLECFAKLAWSTPDGQIYYDALEAALNPPADLVSITAVYTQTMIVYNTDNLSVLRPDLVVTAHYSDSTSAQLYGYLLSGTLTAGASTITVTYGGKTATFTVTVTDAYLLYSLPQATVFDGSAANVIDTGAVLTPQDRDFTVCIAFIPTTTARQYVFYSGDHASPYYAIGIEAQRTTFVWRVDGYNATVELTNVVNNNEARAVVRHVSGSGIISATCICNGQTISGEANARFGSSETMVLGGYESASSSLAFVGTVNEFAAYTRYFSDDEVAGFLNGGE